MKKIIISIFSLIFLFTISSCSNKKYYINKYYDQIENKTIEELEKSDNPYIIFAYNSLCEVCDIYLSEVKKVIENENIPIYLYDSSISDIELEPTALYIRYKDETIKTINKDSILSKSERITYEINKTLKVTNLYEVSNIDTMYKIFESDINSLIYYRLSGCPDCEYFENNFLYNYSFNNDIKIIYFDLNNAKNIDDVKDKLYISNDKNELAYKTGYVPCFIIIKNNTVSNYRLIFNDNLVLNASGEYELIESYYLDNPYLNQSFKDMSKYYSKTIKYYSNQAISIIEEYKNML